MTQLSSNNGTPTRLGGKRTVTADDVIADLLDLFTQLQINSTQVSPRASSAKKGSSSRRLFFYPATILTAWHQTPSYLDNAGNPIAIKVRGSSPSFSRLASMVVPTADPVALLAELKRLGAVTVDKKKLVRVNMRSLPVYMDREFAIHYTLTCLRNYIRTLRHNLESDPTNSDQLFHRIAWNDSFEQALIPALKIKLRRQGQSFLESFDNWMARNTKLAATNGKRSKQAQVSIGIYLAVDGARRRTAP